MTAYELTFKNKWSSDTLRPIVVIGLSLAKAIAVGQKEAWRLTKCPRKFKQYVPLHTLRTLDVIVVTPSQ